VVRHPEGRVKQSRKMSLVEAVTNVVVGFVLAIVTQAALYPILGIPVSIALNVLIATVFTFVSIMRSYVLRRVFEAIRVGEVTVRP
jgi:hypothetical protein